MAQSMFGGVIEFFIKLGVYDVVLPFLLVFTIVFAILEKTKVLGTADGKPNGPPNKNINSMTAFVIAFMVIASAQLVEIILKVSSQFVILLLLSVLFLILLGSFLQQKEAGVFLEEKWLRWLFTIIMLLGILLIFLNAIETESGVTWLQVILDYLSGNWSSTAVASILLLLGMIGYMYFIVSEPEKKSN